MLSLLVQAGGGGGPRWYKGPQQGRGKKRDLELFGGGGGGGGVPVDEVTQLRTGETRDRISISTQGKNIFLFSKTPRKSLGPAQ